MAIAYNWINPHGGSWNDAANWNPSGGPQTAPAYLPADNATFATGSSRPYTVTGQGYGSQIVVSGDHVTFDHFQGFSSWTGGNLIVENGGLVTLQSGSSIVLLSHDGMGGGGPVVTDGTIISHGSI